MSVEEFALLSENVLSRYMFTLAPIFVACKNGVMQNSFTYKSKSENFDIFLSLLKCFTYAKIQINKSSQFLEME